MLAHSYRRGRRAVTLLCVLLASLLMWSGLALTSGSAYAASDGVMLDYGGWTVGTRQLESGEFVFCIEPGAITPSGPQQGPSEVDELRGYSFFTYNDTGWSGVTSSDPITGEPLRQINYVLTQYGNTSEAHEAVAVQFAIWILRSSAGEQAWLAHHISWVETHGGAAEIARPEQLVTEARMLPVENSEAMTPEALILTPLDPHGTGEVSFPIGTQELRIDGGVFADGASVYYPGVEAGTVGWTARLHTPEWAAHQTVHISGSWGLERSVWPARLRIFPSIDPDEQTLAWGVGPVSEPLNGEFEVVTHTIDNTFAPVFSTQAIQFALTQDGSFSDEVTLDVAIGSAPWPQRGLDQNTNEWLPVTLEGHLYGPFAQEQAVQSEVPADAHIIARIELLADAGPGNYQIIAPETPQESGYYYWVWTISQEGQVSQAASALLSEGYVFTDAFGLPEESHLVTMPTPLIEEPPVLAPTQEALASTGGESFPTIGLAIGIVSFAAGTVLVLRAGRRRFQNLQHSSSINL